MPIERWPQNLSFEEAARLMFEGMAALNFIEKSGLKAGDKSLVIGVSGAVDGTIVQFARHRDSELTVVSSAANAELVKSLGVDKVIDYAREDFAKGSETNDVIADTVGASSFSKCVSVLNENGR